MLLLLEIHGMLLDDVVYHCWMLLLDDGFSGSPFIQQHPTTDDQNPMPKRLSSFPESTIVLLFSDGETPLLTADLGSNSIQFHGFIR